MCSIPMVPPCHYVCEEGVIFLLHCHYQRVNDVRVKVTWPCDETYQNGFGNIKEKTTPVGKQTLKGWMVITRRLTFSGPAYFATY